ncbi:hypothetical protein B8A42_04665, partial [Dolosigranulum pigrum]|uniref:GA-like domain-containing protein n=1 Tax=Dolosigranulum pigrum TaxID=29394 RepID=UPI000DBFF65E
EEHETATRTNEHINKLKKEAQTALDGLSASEKAAKDKLQERLDKVNEFDLPSVTPSTKVESANLAIDGSSLDEARKDYYKGKVKAANSDEEIDEILAALTGEVFVKRAEDKAQEAAALVKKATEDGKVTEEEKEEINSANTRVDYHKG